MERRMSEPDFKPKPSGPGIRLVNRRDDLHARGRQNPNDLASMFSDDDRVPRGINR